MVNQILALVVTATFISCNVASAEEHRKVGTDRGLHASLSDTSVDQISSGEETSADWPCWRGPDGDNHSAQQDLPTHWNSDPAQFPAKPWSF
jgi:hypothetical protein